MTGRGRGEQKNPQWRRFAGFAARYGAPSGGYEQLWQWSVDNTATFWRAVWEYFDVPSRGGGPADADAGVLANASMPGAQWFPGVELNYVDMVLRHAHRSGPA
ncbi:MAG: acetyl-coenzyme A synthetase N-terminal domain-containing protein, partial [Mycobacterium sp.]